MSLIPEEIIVKSIRNEADMEELKLLQAWLREDKQNVAFYNQMEEVWQTHYQLPQKSIEEGWNRLQEEILQAPQPLRLQPRRLWLRYVAAIFVGALIAAGGFYLYERNDAVVPEEMLVEYVVCNHTGIQSVLLPDQSEVWLNDNATLRYPEHFDAEQRTVALEGKAYFDVQKNKAQPFFVKLGDAVVEVTGTEFYVDASSEKELQVVLISGGVNLSYNPEAGKSHFSSLIPGQQAFINKESGEMTITETDTEYYAAWKDGTYRFTDVPLEKIMSLVSRRYDMDIEIASALKTKRFTGRVTPNDDIRDVMESIGKSYPVKYQISDRTVVIRGTATE
ncbi:FecR domain-containing protein [Parabacteroides sp. OttesenSCG-928-K15]|nr:FecR domain-containing protein [Parabacteroides sp. OttesenSCG-928-K15]